MAWTKEQQRAIDLDGKNILVSAAAGSGKTAVLAERVVSHLLRQEAEEGAWNVDELLIVTFTRAAAAEMSERIGIRLQQAIAAELDKEKPDRGLVSRLERQVILLSGAAISTIDSFCQSIIKNNFSDLDLDPKFRVADENELLLLQQDVLDELFEQRYEAMDEALLHLGEQYGTDRGDGRLYDIVLKLHEKATNQPFPAEWLRGLAEDFAAMSGTALHLKDYAKWWQVLIDELRTGMARAEDELAEFSLLVSQVDDKKARAKYDERLDRARELVERILSALDGEWEDIYQAFRMLDYKETSFKTMPGGKLEVDAELREQLKGANAALKATVTGLKDKYVLDDEATMLADLQGLSGDAAGLAELAIAFGEAYAAAKRERNIIDYGDMEHFALQLLLSPESVPGNIQPSETALALRRRYKEIMVDEYQDTNEVQDTIVRLIAGENGGNLFTVGDVKQSIYGFRASEPGLFIGKYDAYGAETRSGGGANELISLGRNFRSRREILSAVNFVFAQLMTKEPMEIDYDENAMLNPGEPYGYQEPEEGRIMPLGEAVELDIIAEKGIDEAEGAEENASGAAANGAANDFANGAANYAANGADGQETGSSEAGSEDEEELKSFQLEAQYIADRLKKLKNDGYMVFDKSLGERNNGYRPMQWRDVVVLLRSVKGKADVLQEIFQANDIPVFASTEGGYFQATEIQVVLSLLSVIDNVQQDIPLAAVLYSPIVGLSASQLAKLRLSLEGGNLYQAMLNANSAEVKLSAAIKNKLGDFLSRLSSWRQLSRRAGVAELLWQVYRDTGYYDYVGCMPGGVLRQANLRMLIARAEEFEGTNYRGLFRFLGFIEKMKNMDTDLSVARTLGENEDVVRIMTIHKSKGLEFPVVVLADMGKRFNLMDTSDSILLHKDLGLGLDNIDVEKNVKYPSFSRLAVRAKMVQESKAEELRVLYVAMTRAREKLIMVGRIKDAGKAAAKWCSYREYSRSIRLPRYALSEAGSYLDWVAEAVSRHPAGMAFAGVLEMTCEQYVQSLGYMHAAPGRESQWQIRLVDSRKIHLPRVASREAGELLALVAGSEPLPAAESVAGEIGRMLSWQYDFLGTEDVPAKLSVSELKRRFARQMQEAGQLADGVAAMAVREQREYSFPRPGFLQRREEAKHRRTSGTEYGTLMHSVMQHLDLAGELTEEGIRAQLAVLAEQEIITADQVEMVRTGSIAAFFASPLGRRMLEAKRLWRELPFCRMLPAGRYYAEVRDDSAEIFNQGVIDVLFQEADGRVVLLDYKTDRDTAPAAVKEKYAIQLDLYAEAVRSVLGLAVSEKYLYMLRDGSVIQL